MKKNWTSGIEDSVNEYLSKLASKNEYSFKPALDDLTYFGEKLKLGFSCYGLKSYYTLGLWDKLTNEKQDEWIQYINSFQKTIKPFPDNSYIDNYLLESYQSNKVKTILSDSAKKIVNIHPKYNFESNARKLLKAVNAETKQAISTIHETGFTNEIKVKNILKQSSVSTYLNKFDWSKPWNAGAQFSSLCVYSTTQGYEIKSDLLSFINNLTDKNTGSYFSKRPNSKREVINGAMKVITGLDWLNEEIHHPRQLIDFCLSNTPILEGCDVVDYIYVLYKCSQQVDYKKKEINNVLSNQLDFLEKLYIKNEGGFSYFINKSQTHYYGVEITGGKSQADIHGTTLCLWAISMITNNLESEKLDLEWKVIKP